MTDVFEKRLSNYIASFMQVEQQTEVVRKLLAEQKLFEPYTAFRRLDQERKGFIDEENILEFLGDNQIPISDSMIKILFRFIDHDGDGKILFSDFHRFVHTRDEKLKKLVQLRDSYFIDTNMLLPNEVEWSLARLFQIQIEGLTELLGLKQELIQIRDFFQNMEQKPSSKLSTMNLYQFMIQQGHNVTTQDIHETISLFEKYLSDHFFMAPINYFTRLFNLTDDDSFDRQRIEDKQNPKILVQETQTPNILVQEQIQPSKIEENSQQTQKIHSTPEKSLNQSQIYRDLTPTKSSIPVNSSYYGFESRTIKNNKIELPTFNQRLVPDELRSQLQVEAQDQTLQRLRRLNVKTHELDRAIQQRTQQKIDTLNKLKGMNPQERYKYFDPYQNSQKSIIQAINKYNPQRERPRNVKLCQDDTISCFTQNSYQKIPKTSENSYFSSHSNLRIYG